MPSKVPRRRNADLFTFCVSPRRKGRVEQCVECCKAVHAGVDAWQRFPSVAAHVAVLNGLVPRDVEVVASSATVGQVVEGVPDGVDNLGHDVHDANLDAYVPLAVDTVGVNVHHTLDSVATRKAVLHDCKAVAAEKMWARGEQLLLSNASAITPIHRNGLVGKAPNLDLFIGARASRGSEVKVVEMDALKEHAPLPVSVADAQGDRVEAHRLDALVKQVIEAMLCITALDGKRVGKENAHVAHVDACA